MDRNSSSFMVVNFPLDTELDGFDGLSDLGAGNTIVFTHIPAGVSVYFAIDNNSQSKIQALQGMQIKTNHGGIYFTTVGTSSDPMILAHWASDDMEIITPPISTFESLNGFGLTAVSQLSKAMNPYQAPTLTLLQQSCTSVTRVLSKILNCDKIDVSVFALAYVAGSTGAHDNQLCSVYIDGVVVAQHSQYNSTNRSSGSKNNVVLEDIRGKTIWIDFYNSSAGSNSAFTLQEFTLK